MNYWLLCLPREDLLQCMKVGTFGLTRKNLIGGVKKGDQIVCCAGKGDWKIIGLGSASSDYYIDDSKVFLKDGLFVDRFDFQSDKLPAVREIGVVSILDQLSFVTNLAYWAVFFRNGIVKMSKADWELIRGLTTTSKTGQR